MTDQIVVLGAGGVGGYFGGRLAAHAQTHPSSPRVSFLARGPHLEAMRTLGLRLHTTQGDILCSPCLCSDQVEDLPVAGIYLLAVKSYDLEEVVSRLEPYLEEETLILPLLNGIDIYDRIRAVTQKAKVMPACVYVSTRIAAPGVIEQSGGEGKILLGHDPLFQRHRPAELLELLQQAGIPFEWQADPYPAIWSKFMFIAAYGLVTAASRLSLGEVYQDDALRQQADNVMHEIYYLARAKGVGLSQSIIDQSLERAREFPFEARTSLQRDVESGKGRHEADLFGGTILRLAQELEIAAPATQALMQSIQSGA